MYDLAAVVPKLLPQAIEWVESRSAGMLSSGQPLTAAGIDVYVSDEKVGYNRIEKTLDGCAVLEHWFGSSGDEGKSLFFVNDRGQWKQVWVTEWANRPGGVKEKTIVDIAPEDGVRFQGSLHHLDVGEWLDRTTLKALENGEVRQLIEVSMDNGKTWETSFDAVYRKASTE
jgi:hypothetical protein